MRARGLRLTSLETGETFDLSGGLVDVGPFEGDDVVLAPTGLHAVHSVAFEAPDPALVALVSGDPWMAVWFGAAEQLTALRACAPPRAGTCSACGRPLVRAAGRTYHPAADLPRGAECAALLPAPGAPEWRSYDVEPAAWAP